MDGLVFDFDDAMQLLEEGFLLLGQFWRNGEADVHVEVAFAAVGIGQAFGPITPIGALRGHETRSPKMRQPPQETDAARRTSRPDHSRALQRLAGEAAVRKKPHAHNPSMGQPQKTNP